MVPQVALGGADRTPPDDLDSAGRPRASMGACRSRTNADDCLPVASLGRVERGDSVVEGRDDADVRPQSSVPHPLDDLTQLGTIGLDNEVDRQALNGTLVHFLAEVCPRSRPFRKDRAAVAKRKKGG